MKFSDTLQLILSVKENDLKNNKQTKIPYKVQIIDK